jgi:hypothetical protein
LPVTTGFILGGTIGSNKAVEAFLYNSRMLGVLSTTILVMVPLCYLETNGCLTMLMVNI